MTFVIGRDGGDGPVADLGTYRALDGSHGAPLPLDVDGPHAVTIVGKRGYGKSYTLGVLAEELAATPGVAPVVLDPLGAFKPLGRTDRADVPARVVGNPRVSPGAIGPRAWCSLVDLSPESAAGALVWQAAQTADTLGGMREAVRDADAAPAAVRAATNHVGMADAWDVFDPDGIGVADLADDGVTVLDCSELAAGPMNAVGRFVADSLYRARIDGGIDRLPWLLVDEAHAFFDGVARGGLETLLTRGRAPGASLVVATQRPDAVPEVCLSQSDVLCAHRLTAESDLAALASARPTYADESFERRLPTEPGDVVLVDDVTETVHAARIRERTTPHGGDSPRASEVVSAE